MKYQSFTVQNFRLCVGLVRAVLDLVPVVNGTGSFVALDVVDKRQGYDDFFRFRVDEFDIMTAEKIRNRVLSAAKSLDVVLSSDSRFNFHVYHDGAIIFDCCGGLCWE